MIKFHEEYHQVGQRLYKVFGLIALELWLPWMMATLSSHRLIIGITFKKSSEAMGPTAFMLSI